MGMTSNIRVWTDNPQKDRISNIVRVEFPYKTNWCVFTIEELKEILRCWIIGEEMKYPLDQDIGMHNGEQRGRWMLFEELKKVFYET